MVKSLAFVYNIKQLDLLENKSVNILIALNNDVAMELSKRQVNFKTPYEYSNAVFSIEKEATDLLNNLALANKGYFKSFYDEYNTYLWDLLNYFLFYKSLYFESLASKLEEILIIKKVLDKEKPDEVIIMGHDSFAEEILMPVTEAERIKIKIINVKTENKAIEFIRKTKGHLLSVDAKRTRKIIRKLFWIACKKTSKRDTNSRKKIFMFSNREELIFDPERKIIKKGELFEPISFYLPKDYLPIILDIPLDYAIGIKNLLQNQRNKRVPIENYITAKGMLAAISNHKKAYSEWKKIKNSVSKLLFYKKINIEKILLRRIDFFFRYCLLDLLIEAESINNLIETEKPRMICTFSPQGFIERFAINLFAKEGLPSLGIQHGVITYCIDHISKLPPPNKFRNLFYMAVFGDYYKDFLVKHSIYKKDLIKVTGYPKFDVLNHLQLKKEKICKELSIDAKKKIIVLTTQPMQLEEETKAMAHAVCNAVKKLENACLIIKAHPRELSISPYKEIIRKTKIKDAICIQDFDLYKILSICDVMITGYSTTILEASILNKTSIIIDTYKKGYASIFNNHGSILVSNNDAELEQNIKKALYNKKIKNKLKRLRQEFVYKHCYKIDGMSNKRIAKFIEEIERVHSKNEGYLNSPNSP